MLKNKKIVKVIIAIIAVFIALIFKIGVCSKNGSKDIKINLAEVAHSAFYAPMYVAIEEGFFKEKGLDVDLILTSGANNVTAAVLSGDVEIGFCGPEATIYVYNGGEKDYIQTFAGLTKRDGQFIVSREQIKAFDWKMLKGKEVLAGRIAGMPELNFENALKNAGVNKNEVNINTSVDFASLSSAFISGQGDFVNLFEPNATKIANLGYGYVVSSIGEKSGEMPYTAFNAKKSFIDNNPDIIKKFTAAISKGLNYVKENDEKTIANSIINQFPDTSINDMISIIKRYKEADSWLSSPYISEKSFKNLEEIVKEAGEIDDYVPYEDLINNFYKKE